MVNNQPIWARGSDPDPGVCMKVRFKYKVTRSFPVKYIWNNSFLSRSFAALSQLSPSQKNQEKRETKENLQDQGK